MARPAGILASRSSMVVASGVLLALLASVSVAAAADEAPGLVRGGEYAAGALGATRQPAPSGTAVGTVYGVGAWPVYTPALADGPGRDVVQGACSMCHNTTYITMQPPLPAATWQAEVTKMIKTFGAPISEETARTVVDYLKAHYTPETRRD